MHPRQSPRSRRSVARLAGLTACAASAACLATGVASRAARADDAAPIEEVHVQGDPLRDPVAPKDRSVAGSVLTRDRLVGPGLEAQDVLRTQPGVAVTESGGFGAPATAAIRGATAADTPVYLGGVRLNDDVGGTADLALVPLWLIDRIEIYRGNAPLEADRLGPGGAIFFEPRRPASDAAGVGYSAGSWGASKGWAYGASHAGPVHALVGISADRATNRYPFVDDQGTLFEPANATRAVRENADETTVEGWGLASVDLGGGATVDVLANGITRDQGVPSLALVQTTLARQRSERFLASVAAHVPLRLGQGDGEGAVLDARSSVIVGRTALTNPLLMVPAEPPELTLLGRRVEETVGATFDVGDTLRLRPSAIVAHEGIERDPGDIPLAQAHRDFARLAVGAEERPSEGVTLRALASGECHHTGATTGTLCDVLEPTGRLGVEAGTPRLRVLANVGRYVRVPTLGETYGVSSLVRGNPTLAPETGATADLGVRAQTRGGRRGAVLEGAYLDAFVFARWADGLIAYERTGQGSIKPYNVGRARVLGAEVLTGVLVTSFLRAEVAVTALDPRDTSPDRTTVNDVLPFRSPLIVAPRLRADWASPRPAGSTDGISAVGGEVRALYQSSRYVDPAGLGVIGEQATVDAEADVVLERGLLTARARVADLFDARRTDVIGYPLPGRSFYAGLEAAW